jgi:hypothetical protein
MLLNAVVAPMLEEARGFRRHHPFVGIGPVPPLIHVPEEFVNDRRRIVLLPFGGEASALVKNDLLLLGPAPRCRGFGIGVMKENPAAASR